jgi:hypothetical protein
MPQQFGTAEEARAMIDRAVAALKSEEAKALRDFNGTKNKLFHDRDLYISCFDTAFTKLKGADTWKFAIRRCCKCRCNNPPAHGNEPQCEYE